jgi:hypothetical protein
MSSTYYFILLLFAVFSLEGMVALPTFAMQLACPAFTLSSYSDSHLPFPSIYVLHVLKVTLSTFFASKIPTRHRISQIEINNELSTWPSQSATSLATASEASRCTEAPG